MLNKTSEYAGADDNEIQPETDDDEDRETITPQIMNKPFGSEPEFSWIQKIS